MLAMTHVGYVAAGWGISLLALGAYALRTVRRGRSLAARVPPEERRWS
jgi:heme exporter protein D